MPGVDSAIAVTSPTASTIPVNISESIQRKRKLQLLLFMVLAKAGAFAYVRAKAGAFAYARAKGWSLRLPQGKGWSLRLPQGKGRSLRLPQGKGWSLRLPQGKGWSLRLRQGQRLEPSLTSLPAIRRKRPPRIDFAESE